MTNNTNKWGFILDHLFHEYISDPSEDKAKNEGPALTPQEAAVKIWEQWMLCRLLSDQLNSSFEFKINNPE